MSEPHEQISHLILGYLGKHPEAQDTLEGIADWWLTFERIEQSTLAVVDALDVLVQQGIVTRKVTEDGTVFYKLNACN
jgi:Fe2+ or Zn2+ uptake regulation protein